MEGQIKKKVSSPKKVLQNEISPDFLKKLEVQI